MGAADPEWAPVYETRSQLDADLVRTTLEVAGYPVVVLGETTRGALVAGTPNAITVSVPAKDADDARDFLREKTSLLSNQETAPASGDEPAADTETIVDAAKEVMDLRRDHKPAACKYCGIATLDVSETELDSHKIALLRAAGLGVNTATFSEFKQDERICTDCAGHEVSCDLCGRTLDAFLDEGEYRQANEDEAYICRPCIARLEDQLQSTRDW
jgi:hypothetical protein